MHSHPTKFQVQGKLFLKPTNSVLGEYELYTMHEEEIKIEQLFIISTGELRHSYCSWESKINELKEIKTNRTLTKKPLLFFFLCNAMQDDEREICKCMDTCYLQASSPPPNWLTNRVQGDTHRTGRKPDFRCTAFKAVPLRRYGLFAAACVTGRCLQCVGWEFLGSVASSRWRRLLGCWGREAPEWGHDNLGRRMSGGRQRAKAPRLN